MDGPTGQIFPILLQWKRLAGYFLGIDASL